MNSQKHSVVQLTPRYFPSLGGVEKHVLQLNLNLKKRGYDVRVITVQHGKMLAEYEETPSGTIYRMPQACLHNKLQTWLWIFKNRTLFSNSIIHVHDVGWWLVPLLPVVFKNFYMTFHGWEGRYPVPLRNKLHRWILAACAKKTMHIGGYIQNFYWDKPNIVLYGAVENQNIQVKLLNPFSKKRLQCVFLGRLESENDIEKYVRFFELAKKEKIPMDVTWVGDGAFKKVCEEYGAVTGMVKDTSVYISKADFVCATSYLSILEAQALGKIVISFYPHELKKLYLTSYPGSSYMVITCEPEEGIVKMKSFIQQPELLQQLSTQAQTFAKKQTWEGITHSYLALWDLGTK